VDIGFTVSAAFNKLCTITSDSAGEVPQTGCPLPTTTPNGSYAIQANAQSKGGTATGASQFALNAEVTLLDRIAGGQPTTQALIGEDLSVSGARFSPSSTVTATIGGNSVATTPVMQTDAKGSFGPVTLTVPSIAAAPRSVVFTDSNGPSASWNLTLFKPSLA